MHQEEVYTMQKSGQVLSSLTHTKADVRMWPGNAPQEPAAGIEIAEEAYHLNNAQDLALTVPKATDVAPSRRGWYRAYVLFLCKLSNYVK